MANKPQARHSINVSTGKTSYLLLKKKGQPFQDAYDPALPKVGTIYAITVKDDDNDFFFDATIVPQKDKKRLALKLVSGLPAGGADPLDGLLTITLHIVTALVPLSPPTTTLEPVSDAPVDYILDPGGP